MKVTVVVQRYGEAINGGAELHARHIAEHLGRHVDVEVLTTCASDYVTWRNELAPGLETIHGVRVRRFPVAHERDPIRFARLSARVFTLPHSVRDELQWIDAEGPASPQLIRHLARHGGDYDVSIFFSYRYYHAFHGVRAVPSRTVLVPTAERDPAMGLSIFPAIFRGVDAVMYNSPEERAMIQAASGNHGVRSVVVGVGSNIPDAPQAARFRQAYGLREPFAIYVGRIDENKGCKELFEHFRAYHASGGRLSLVLVGHSLLPIPEHRRIRHLGFLSDRDKFDAIAAADVLIMPSYYESLSLVALEAWGLGRPVLANARCDVLKGQCLRSNAGLFYANQEEFVEALRAFERNSWLAGLLGRNGRRFYHEHYDWHVIERKYLDVLSGLPAVRQAVEPLPGWFDRRRADCRPAEEVVRGLPAGPVVTASEVAAPCDVPEPERLDRRPQAAPSNDARRPATFRQQRRSRGHQGRVGRRA